MGGDVAVVEWRCLWLWAKVGCSDFCLWMFVYMVVLVGFGFGV